MEDKGIKIIRLLLQIQRKIRQSIKHGNLSHGEYMVLRRIMIEQSGDENNIKVFKALRISDHLSIPPSALTRILNSLERQELIERKINLENRRSVIIELTENGKNILSKADEEVKSFAKRLTDSLGAKRANNLIESLDTILDFCQMEINE